MNLKAIFEYSEFNKIKTVIIGVSGGSDSLCLLLSFIEYCKILITPPKIVVVTVNHKLRIEAIDEAFFVQDVCNKNNIEHHIIEWDGSVITSDLSQQARFNRYKILYDVALKYPNPIIMVGHNLNDRIETFLMRKKRNSIRGLSAIASFSLLFDKIYLWRPLLNYSKKDIQQYLVARNQIWMEDPTNKNIKYERAAIRESLGKLTLAKLQNWQNILEESANKRLDFNKKISNLLKNLPICFIEECLILNLENIANYPEVNFIIGLCASIMGGTDYLPGQNQLNLIKSLWNEENTKINICRSIIEKKHNIFYIWRENRNIKPMLCPAFSTIIWDNRYKIFNKTKKNILIRNIKCSELKQPYKYNTRLVIEYENKIFLPFSYDKIISTLAYKSNKFEITKNISIYNWLVSGFDFELYNILKNIYIL